MHLMVQSWNGNLADSRAPDPRVDDAGNTELIECSAIGSNRCKCQELGSNRTPIGRGSANPLDSLTKRLRKPSLSATAAPLELNFASTRTGIVSIPALHSVM
jgi:hypothetical protein